MLYYNPAVSSFHEAQDAISIRISDEQIQLALADGVSIVRKLWDNDSGKLAHQLVTTLCSNSNKDITETVNQVVSEFSKDGKIGASTLIYGEISQTKQLRLYLAGGKTNLGTICVYTGSHTERIVSQSRGVIGERFTPDDIHRTLPDTCTLLATTDGILIPDTNINAFMRDIHTSLSEETAAIDIFSTHTQPSADDQSLLVISRH